jgi:enoyl-CoA hydratase
MIERRADGRHVVLRMAHGKANVFDTGFLRGLSATLRAEADAEAPALVLTGTGTIFSAGVDLKRMTEGGRGYLEEFLPALSECLRTLFSLPLPVVAAVNGHAIAGGCMLALASDHRVMARGRGRIGVPELAVGVPFPWLGLEVVRFALPPQHVQEAIYSGATYDPDQALARGFVDELAEESALLARAGEVAECMAAVPAISFRMTKEALRRPVIEAFDRGAATFERRILDAWSSEPVQAAVRAYVEKTLRR